MSVLAFTPSGEGLTEKEIPGFHALIAKAIVRLRCMYRNKDKAYISKVSTGFVYNCEGHVISVAHGFPKGYYDAEIAYFGEEFQAATVTVAYDYDSALVIPKTPRGSSDFLQPIFKVPRIGKWLFTVAHAGKLQYTYYEGKCSSLPRSVRRLNEDSHLSINFPSRFQFIPIKGMDLCEGTSGAPITDNTGRVFGMNSFQGRNLGYVIHSFFIPHFNPAFLGMKEKMHVETIHWLRSRSNPENVSSKESAVFTESSSMVEVRDRFRSATTAGQRDDTQDMRRPSKGNFDVSSGIAEKETPTESSRMKQKGQEIVKKPPHLDFGRVDDSDGSVGIQNAVSGNLVPFDHSRVQRGIEQAFDRVRSVMEAYSGERKTSSREKQKRWEIVKKPAHEDLGRVEIDPFDDSDDTVAIQNAVSGNLVPFDHSRVHRGIEQAFKKLRC